MSAFWILEGVKHCSIVTGTASCAAIYKFFKMCGKRWQRECMKKIYINTNENAQRTTYRQAKYIQIL